MEVIRLRIEENKYVKEYLDKYARKADPMPKEDMWKMDDEDDEERVLIFRYYDEPWYLVLRYPTDPLEALVEDYINKVVNWCL